MKIYSINPLYDKYKSYIPKNLEVAAERYSSIRCKGKPLSWPSPLEIVSDEEDIGIPEADIGFINIGSLVFTEHAYQCTKEILLSFGELLPLNYEGRQLWLWNVTNTLDALDKNNSLFNGFGGVIKPVFLENKINPISAFKIREDNFTNIYCTEDFRGLLLAKQLTGIEFEEF